MQQIEQNIKTRESNEAKEIKRKAMSPEHRKLRVQQRSLERYQHYQKKRAKFQAFVSSELGYTQEDVTDGRKSLFAASDNFRAK